MKRSYRYGIVAFYKLFGHLLQRIVKTVSVYVTPTPRYVESLQLSASHIFTYLL